MNTELQQTNDVAYRGSALGASARQQPRPADLSSLRDLLQNHIGRARDLGYRAHSIADAVMGSVPTAVSTGTSDRDRPLPSLAELMDELSSALSNIDAGLNRL